MSLDKIIRLLANLNEVEFLKILATLGSFKQASEQNRKEALDQFRKFKRESLH